MKKWLLLLVPAVAMALAFLAVFTTLDTPSAEAGVRIGISCDIADRDDDGGGPDFGAVHCRIVVLDGPTFNLMVWFNDTAPPPGPSFRDTIVGCTLNGNVIHAGPCPDN